MMLNLFFLMTRYACVSIYDELFNYLVGLYKIDLCNDFYNLQFLKKT